MTTDERNALAKELADLRRCEILTSIVTHPDAAVSDDVIAYATAPKDK